MTEAPLLTEAQVLKAASAFVGAPYRLRGQTPDGWDCQGCALYLRKALFGRHDPSYAEVYDAADSTDPAQVEALLTAHLSRWEPVERRPGALVLLRWAGRPGHVGLVLSQRLFIHALEGCETALGRFDERMWARRVIGYYDRS